MSVMKLGGHECDVQRRRRCDFSHCVSCVIKQKNLSISKEWEGRQAVAWEWDSAGQGQVRPGLCMAFRCTT